MKAVSVYSDALGQYGKQVAMHDDFVGVVACGGGTVLDRRMRTLYVERKVGDDRMEGRLYEYDADGACIRVEKRAPVSVEEFVRSTSCAGFTMNLRMGVWGLNDDGSRIIDDWKNLGAVA
jgi:hypothetical protein